MRSPVSLRPSSDGAPPRSPPDPVDEDTAPGVEGVRSSAAGCRAPSAADHLLQRQFTLRDGPRPTPSSGRPVAQLEGGAVRVARRTRRTPGSATEDSGVDEQSKQRLAPPDVAGADHRAGRRRRVARTARPRGSSRSGRPEAAPVPAPPPAYSLYSSGSGGRSSTARSRTARGQSRSPDVPCRRRFCHRAGPDRPDICTLVEARPEAGHVIRKGLVVVHHHLLGWTRDRSS